MSFFFLLSTVKCRMYIKSQTSTLLINENDDDDDDAEPDNELIIMSIIKVVEEIRSLQRLYEASECMSN